MWIKNRIGMKLFEGNDGGGAGEGGTGAAGTKTNAGTQSTPPATPPVDVTQVAANAKADMLKSLGFEDEDSLKAIIEAHNKQVEANKGELEKTQGDLTKATKANADLTTNNTELKATVAALKAGVTNEHLSDAMILAKAYIANKDNPAKTFDEAIAAIVKSNPGYTGSTQAPAAAVNDNLGGTGGQQQTTMTDVEKLNEHRITH